MKDQFNALDVRRQPGPLVPAFGARVEQFYALLEDVPVSGAWGSGKATIWAETLWTGGGAETTLSYGAGNGWLEGHAAAVTKQHGKGRNSYRRAAAKSMLEAAGVRPVAVEAPHRVEVCRRVGGGREVLVLINHTTQPAKVVLPRAMTDVLNGGEIRERTIAPRGVVVVLSSQ